MTLKISIWLAGISDGWDFSIPSFVRGLLMLQFEGKQKWQIILLGEHSLVIDMQHICPWQLVLIYIFLTILKTIICLNLFLNCMIYFDTLSHRFLEPSTNKKTSSFYYFISVSSSFTVLETGLKNKNKTKLRNHKDRAACAKTSGQLWACWTQNIHSPVP